MALYFLRDFFDDIENVQHAPTIRHQHFGLGTTPQDLFNSVVVPLECPIRRPRYYRPWAVKTRDTGSVVKHEKNQFEVNLDVQQFRPEEISVKVVDDSIVVEGKHEEKEDEHGFISRHFVRRYVLPKEYELKNVKPSLSSDGILTITAPKCNTTETQERVIQITHTGPHKAVKVQESKGETLEEKK